MKKNFKLLSKITVVYLIVTFVVFFATAFFLFRAVDNYLDDEVEDRFRYFEHRAMRSLHKGHRLKINRRYLDIKKLETAPDLTKYPGYTDTTMYNSHLDKNSLFRKKTIIISHKDSTYKMVMVTGLDEFVILKDAVAQILIPAFVLLAIIVVLTNFGLSGFFLKPFYKILELMKIYKVGSKEKLYLVNTTTSEFKKMQSLFNGMVDRIEDDYKNLKEYTENMAHEMQTPLAVMRNKVLDMMSDEKIMSEKADVIKPLYDEINQLSILGKTLNLLTRIENNEYRNSEKINTKEYLEEIIETHKELAELKNIKFEHKLSEENELLIDKKLFRIMIDNLMRNAVRYSDAEGAIKVISTKDFIKISNYGEKLKIDSGKIFERFVSQNNDSNSIGLGLSIVKKICDLNCIEIDYLYEDGQHIFALKSNCLAD